MEFAARTLTRLTRDPKLWLIPAAGGFIPTSSLDVNATDVIGTERDLFVQQDSGSVGLNANLNAVGLLEFTSSPTGNGIRRVAWDGNDDDPVNLDPTGLGGIDLTTDGTIDRLVFQIGADQVDGEVTIKVYSNGVDVSQVVRPIDNTGGTPGQQLSILFSDFSTFNGNGADFTNVGAIELDITGINAVDGQIGSIESAGPINANFAVFEPLTLGDLVFNDIDNDGMFDSPAENGIGGVALNLFQDTDNSNSFTPGTDVQVASTTTDTNGVYGFSNLFPDDYVVQIAPSNFNAGNVLEGRSSSTGNQPTPDPDDNVNSDDNGDELSGQGVVSQAITLVANNEPTNDGDSDPDTNLTLDFGFFADIDLAVSTTDSVDPVVPGEQLTYTLTVNNVGPSTATNVVLTDTLPAGTTYVSANTDQGSVSHNNGIVTANLGSLSSSAGTIVTITVEVDSGATAQLSNVATVAASEIDTVTENNTDTETTDVSPRVDLTIEKMDSPDPVIVGGELAYQLTVTNHGPSNATNVVVTDNLPDDVTFGGVIVPGGTGSHSNGVVTANVGNLGVGASTDITINTTVDADASGLLTNQASVTSNETDTNPSDNSVSEQSTVSARVDVAIAKIDSPDPVTAGRQLTYTLTATNNGPSTATSVTVVDTLPDEVEFDDVDTSQGTASHANGIVTASLGSLASGANATVTIVVDVDSATTGQLDNTAEITAAEVDTNEGNNSTSQSTGTNQRADLSVSKSDSPDPVVAGEVLTYSLVVTNHGPSDASGVTLMDTLPQQTSYITGSSDQGSVTHNAGMVNADIGDLAAGESATVTVEVEVDDDFAGVVDNSAIVSAAQIDDNTGNNQVTESTLVELIPVSISGSVYIDQDDDGIRDSQEPPIALVEITLTGTDVLGSPVEQVDLTDENGAYKFSNLNPGTYQVTETQPVLFPDGKDTQGTPEVGQVLNDMFDQMELSSGTDAVNYNFGEHVPNLSLRMLFASNFR